MTERPINLDDRRTIVGKLHTELRRGAANTGSLPRAGSQAAGAEIDAALRAGPARTWIEAMEKACFLLNRYSATPEARDVRIRKLIRSLLNDLAQLKKHEEDDL